MFDRIGAFMPVHDKRDLFMPGNNLLQNMSIPKKGPFVMLEHNDASEYTVNRFLEALRDSHLEDAMVYISKNYVDKVDITELSQVFDEEKKLCSKLIVKASFENGPKNCKTNTFMVVDKKSRRTSVFHIYMLNEPDMFGKWKIYGIEQE